MPSAQDERTGFHLRFCKALSDAGWATVSPSRLTQEFNARAGDGTVTLHAVRKWMLGESIPTQTKVIVLADWLGVNAGWLRFGTEPASKLSASFNTQDSVLLAEVAQLSDTHKKLAREMMRMLVKVGSK